MSESLGVLVGVSNALTRARSRVPAAGEADAALRDRLLTRARRALEGRDSFIHDAVLLGRRVRLFTNSHHLADFWRDNLWTDGEWSALAGGAAPRDPALTVYAVIRDPEEAEASYAAPAEAYLFNTSYYADLRACTMEALGRLAPEVRVLHGGAVEVGGRALLLLYPKEVIHPTPVWGLMEAPGARFLADGWVAADAAGRLHPLEKQVYFRASLVAHYPALAPRLGTAKFENVPPGPAPEARLTASDDARALVDPARLFGPSRVLRAPAPAAAVFRLEAGPGEAFREAKAEGFRCPGFEVRPAAVAGHPRELARMIAHR